MSIGRNVRCAPVAFRSLLSLLPGLRVGANSIPRSRHSFFRLRPGCELGPRSSCGE
uniref:Uncharacterized protein n=1 Tax=Utricularia reniformis TaxID=192314 RepID=A0A1Y0AZI5_9LAMI|nr:hypothetical protein AEK19_MT0318 [Utricularia reniformis]ART30592.1 hypothetical protein AEK19_MT0318 [Utricularia reniformis]